MTPPDSDERVSGDQLEILRYTANLRARQDSRSGVEVVPETILRLVAEVERGRSMLSIPLPLAQRILAALEQEARSGNVTAQRLEALASELRAAVERKP